MYNSLLYKEWLKIRYFLLGYFVIIALLTGYLFLDIRHNLAMQKPINIWLYIIQRKMLFYQSVKYVPLLGGILLGLAQFIPEMARNRFRLSFHLPLPEVKMLLFVVGVGFLVLFAADLCLFGGLLLVTAHYFTAEIVRSMAATVLPWLVAGIAGYFATATITVEHSWKFRIIYAVLAYGFIQLLFNEIGYGEYVNVIGKYILMTFLLAFTIIFPGYRLRKGSK